MAEIREQIGTFSAKAVGAEWSETEQKSDGTGGKPQVAIRFQITDDNAGDRKGKPYMYFGSLAETKMGDGTVADRTVETLLYCGARCKDGDLMDLEGVTKNEVEVVLVWDEYNGKRTEKISFVNPKGAVFVKRPLSDDKKKSLSVSMKGLVNKVRGDLAKNANEVGGLPVDASGKPSF